MNGRAKILALVSSLVWMPTVAFAYCPGGDLTLPDYQPDYYSVKKEFGRAQLVLEAVLEKETWLGVNGAPARLTPSGTYIGTWYELRVTRIFKGQHSDHVRLFSENSTARFEFDLRKPYVLFVTEERFDPPIGRALTIDTCGNSGRKSARLLQQLNSLRPQTVANE